MALDATIPFDMDALAGLRSPTASHACRIGSPYLDFKNHEAMNQESEAGGPSAPDSRYANFVLGAMFVLYILNFVDRQLLNLFLEDIKSDLQVSDTAMGALTGLAFALFYTIAGIPLARWADRGSRTLLITLGLVAWSAMTAVSGLAKSFVQLAAARVGVGIGEASFTPAAHSLLSDYFPVSRRATALAIFAAGASAGNLVGYAGGGLLGDALGWRNAFILVGLIGLPFAVVFWLTVKEPVRTSLGGTPVGSSDDSLGDVWRYLFSRRSFVLLAASAAMHGFSSYGSGAWIATFLRRVHGLSLTETGMVLALTAGLCGLIGQIAFGRLADHLGQRDVRWYMRLPAITSLVSLPLVLLFLWLDDPFWAIAAFVPGSIVVSAWTGPTYAMAQSLARPHMRAMASAIIVFLLNLIGLGLGPLIVGMLNDALTPSLGEVAVRYSLTIVVVPHALAALLNLASVRTLKQDLRAAAE